MSEALVKRYASDDVALYEVVTPSGDPPQAGITQYVSSTPEGRKTLNVPDHVGYRFTELLRRSVLSTFRAPPLAAHFRSVPDKNGVVLHFLRGGLNFRIRNALAEAYGWNRHYSSFMTSQRYRSGDDWVIRDDQYRKFSVPEGATLFVGDVIATGKTLENGMHLIIDGCVRDARPIRKLVVVTIGSDVGVQVIRSLDKRLRDVFPATYEGAVLVYLEGRFGLAGTENRLTFGLPGTDLLRFPGLLAPEFERSQYEAVSYALERCTIYDVGAKSFEFREYIQDVQKYWFQLAELGAAGRTLLDAYHERWPEVGYESPEALSASRSSVWRGLDAAFYEDLFAARERLWDAQAEAAARQPDSLLRLARRRLAELEAVLR